jgi:succinate dehydrogenase/fumarate reductase cytochrome b subunit
MKALAARTSGILAGFSLFVGKAFAALNDPSSGSISGLSTGDLKDALVNVIVKVLDFVILLAVIFVIVAGIRLVVSGGDEGQKDTAKKTIIYVIVGIIVVLFARVIVTFVNNLF